MALQENLFYLTLEQARRAILLAFFCDIPIALWGAPGIGKSSMVKQLAMRLGMRVYDFRLSDKERSDIGGIPMPVKVDDVPKYIEYLIARGLLPFDTDEECILFLDEVDRTDDPGVKNAIQQVILDRVVNNHRLSPNCRIVLAGNGTSDIDTSQLSKAANGRMVHIYIENESISALDSWLEWAGEETEVDGESVPNASGLLRAFAQHNHGVWVNGQGKEQREIQEQAEPTNRTWVYADMFIRAADNPEIDFKTSDILKALVAGCVGKGAAIQLLDFRDLYLSAPSLADILADPDHVAVPARPDILAALTYSLTDQATRDRQTGESVATYGLRWPEEPAAFLMRRLLEKQPAVATTAPYQQWSHKRLRHAPTAAAAQWTNHLPELAKIFVGSSPKPENDQWVNRLQIPSRSNPNAQPYILSQSRKDKHWACSCPGFVHRRNCDHVKRVPAHMRAGDPTFTGAAV